MKGAADDESFGARGLLRYSQAIPKDIVIREKVRVAHASIEPHQVEFPRGAKIRRTSRLPSHTCSLRVEWSGQPRAHEPMARRSAAVQQAGIGRDGVPNFGEAV